MPSRLPRFPQGRHKYVPLFTDDVESNVDYDDWLRDEGLRNGSGNSPAKYKHPNVLIGVLTVLGSVLFATMLVFMATIIEQIDGLPWWGKLLAIFGYFLASLCLFVACIVGIFVKCIK